MQAGDQGEIERSMSKRTYDITQEYLAACNLLSVDPDRALQQAGLGQFAASECALSLTPRQIASIFGAIVAEYGQDDFHIKLANGFAKGAFGNAFLALQCSENLREGIYRAARFKELLEPVKWTITETGTSFSVRLDSQTPDFPFGGINQIMSFLWLVQSCRNITAKHIVPTRVCVTDAVMRQQEIEEEMGCPIEVTDEACVELPLQAMDTAILSSSRYVVSGLDAGAANTSCRARPNTGFVAAVHSNVLELLPSGVVTSNRIAKRMSLSKRTLERRLSEQGSTFTEIVRHCRLRMADHYLRNTQLPITEIGFLVGYREINSFYRAFKAWHGQTPQQVRNECANDHLSDLSKIGDYPSSHVSRS
jgi:AraC-like DNA-binding protein